MSERGWFRVARNVLWLGVGETGSKGALFVAGIIVARGLGPEGMGVFTVAFGAAMVLQQLLAAGQPEVTIREVAQQRSVAASLVGEARKVQERVALVAVPAAVAGVALVAHGSLLWTLLAFVPYAWIKARSGTLGAVFKGLDRMDLDSAGRIVEMGATLALLAAVAAGGLPVWWTGPAFAAGAAAGLAWYARMLRRYRTAGGEACSRAFLFRQGLPFTGGSMALQLLVRAGAFLLAALGVGEAAIGRFGVAHAITWGGVGLAQLLAVAMYPTVSRATAAGGFGVGRVALLGGAGAAIGTAMAGAVWLIREPLVALAFGARFAESADLLGVLAWALPGLGTSMLLGISLAARGVQVRGMVVQSVTLVAVVVADLLVIPRYATMGAAVVQAVAHDAAGAALFVVALVAARSRPGAAA